MVLSSIVLAFAAFLGLAMELYKKTIRKDRAKELEIRAVAFCASAALGYVTFSIVVGSSLDGGLNETPFLIVLYTVVIYLLQLPACMAVWKPLVRQFLEKKVT